MYKDSYKTLMIYPTQNISLYWVCHPCNVVTYEVTYFLFIEWKQ